MRALALTAALLAAAAPAGAREWTPFGEVTALGGLHTFDGKSGSFTGDLDASAAAATRLSETWSLLPSLRGRYEGTRPLTDALGTATPNQQSAEARLGVRAVWARPDSRWRVKPTLSYDVELLKEARGEAWGQGLFDQRRMTVGGEVERLTDEERSVRASAAWFSVTCPNYTSLESQAALQFQGRSLSRELVGDRVLDREGYQFAVSGDAALGPRLAASARAAGVWSRYSRQHLVDEGGQFSGETRQDVLSDFSFSLRMPHEWNADLRALGSFEVGVLANSSNQNGYDATRGRFHPGFYDFFEWRAQPAASLIVGPVRRPVTARVRLGLKSRRYPHRSPQDPTGAERGGSLTTTEWSGGLSLTYPVAKRLSLVFALDRASASSNTDFQPFYRYSYQSTTAQAGVKWEW